MCYAAVKFSIVIGHEVLVTFLCQRSVIENSEAAELQVTS